MRRLLELGGPILCGAAAIFMLAGLVVDLDSAAARVLIATAGILFVPGAFLTLAYVRRHVGPPR
ncbi:MAG: hypothetical protein ACR2HI_07875 [Gaiella sp.]